MATGLDRKRVVHDKGRQQGSREWAYNNAEMKNVVRWRAFVAQHEEN